mmetsp:Transcript_11438/g.15611  ORF Transcript_11438/g.15611 Transcript_11438/m.15611 type:complete len:291 (-) Transcript_11438:976-1848(-)|eukprot:CAMPEP_0197289230 /NCGR_PEP_ID=MMETSP0890-20130614/6456_1 /TAXON_ID=44058 ORGANISM="Aureoumbra lagunensis, Strain CCMP1510" /NCGR_SAMPLE_ID=MMETSP0890 /ASSEMBLY_ACC=CAM_ASM_000533 /LENGTH=290 /DNA_ID=CAMNT_0042760501 /DNA_START=176 /DNA_END=1048 /DNA_ORIENTATION=-
MSWSGDCHRAEMFDDDVRAVGRVPTDDALSFDRVATAVSIDNSLAQDSSEEEFDPDEIFNAEILAAIGYNKDESSVLVRPTRPKKILKSTHDDFFSSRLNYGDRYKIEQMKRQSFLPPIQRVSRAEYDPVAVLSKKVFAENDDFASHDIVELDDDNNGVLFSENEQQYHRELPTRQLMSQNNTTTKNKQIDPQLVQNLIDHVLASDTGFDLLRSEYNPREKFPSDFVGAYGPVQRKARVGIFIQKRRNRVWTKKVKYNVRKNFADSRMRVKGRFVKKEDEELLKELVSVI